LGLVGSPLVCFILLASIHRSHGFKLSINGGGTDLDRAYHASTQPHLGSLGMCESATRYKSRLPQNGLKGVDSDRVVAILMNSKMGSSRQRKRRKASSAMIMMATPVSHFTKTVASAINIRGRSYIEYLRSRLVLSSSPSQPVFYINCLVFTVLIIALRSRSTTAVIPTALVVIFNVWGQLHKPSLFSLISGGFGGLCFGLAGHPLDLMKTQMQASKEYSSGWDCFVDIVQKGGVWGLFKGVSAPLLGSVPVYALYFWSYAMAEGLVRWVAGKKLSSAPLGLWGVAWAGCQQLCWWHPWKE